MTQPRCGTAAHEGVKKRAYGLDFYMSPEEVHVLTKAAHQTGNGWSHYLRNLIRNHISDCAERFLEEAISEEYEAEHEAYEYERARQRALDVAQMDLEAQSHFPITRRARPLE